MLSEHSICIIKSIRIISTEAVEVQAALLFDGVAGEPAAESRRVIAVAVVHKTGFGVVVLRGEAEVELVVGEWWLVGGGWWVVGGGW